MSIDALSLLGLPNPDTLDLPDLDFLVVYRDMCGSLEVSTDGTVVTCRGDGTLFDLSGQSTSAHDDDGQDNARLRLLAVLIRPTSDDLRCLRSRMMNTFRQGDRSERVRRFQDSPSGRALREFRAAIGTVTGFLIRPLAQTESTLLSLHGEFSSAPGISWITDITVRTFGQEWAMVLYSGDYEEEALDAFPRILGFARRAAFPRSVAHILAHASLYSIHPETYVSIDGRGGFDDYFLELCWKAGGDEEEAVGLGQDILKLSDADLHRLYAEKVDYVELARAVAEVRAAIDDERIRLPGNDLNRVDADSAEEDGTEGENEEDEDDGKEWGGIDVRPPIRDTIMRLVAAAE